MADIDRATQVPPSSLGLQELQFELTRRETSNLVGRDAAADVARFLDLCRRTLDWLPQKHKQPFRLDPTSAACGVLQSRHWSELQPDRPDLIAAWQEWSDTYHAILSRNPRLELAGMMRAVGELVDASSWPYGLEAELRDWVDRDARLPLPAALRAHAESEVDDRFYARLRMLWIETGGWCWWDDVAGMVVWRPDATGMEASLAQ